MIVTSHYFYHVFLVVPYFVYLFVPGTEYSTTAGVPFSTIPLFSFQSCLDMKCRRPTRVTQAIDLLQRSTRSMISHTGMLQQEDHPVSFLFCYHIRYDTKYICNVIFYFLTLFCVVFLISIIHSPVTSVLLSLVDSVADSPVVVAVVVRYPVVDEHEGRVLEGSRLGEGSPVLRKC